MFTCILRLTPALSSVSAKKQSKQRLSLDNTNWRQLIFDLPEIKSLSENQSNATIADKCSIDVR